MDKIKSAYNQAPSWLKIALLNGGYNVFTLLMLDLDDGFELKAYISIGVAVVLNIFTHLILKEQKNEETAE